MTNTDSVGSGGVTPSPRYTILWSTQGGRAKACARRTARILRDADGDGGGDGGDAVDTGYYGRSFDDYGAAEVLRLGRDNGGDGGAVGEEDGGGGGVRLVILFVSTTGDAEHCDSIRDTWKAL